MSETQDMQALAAKVAMWRDNEDHDEDEAENLLCELDDLLHARADALGRLNAERPPAVADDAPSTEQMAMDGINWLVVRKRDIEPHEVNAFRSEAAARRYHDRAQENWTSCCLCRIVKVGAQPDRAGAEQPKMFSEAEVRELMRGAYIGGWIESDHPVNETDMQREFDIRLELHAKHLHEPKPDPTPEETAAPQQPVSLMDALKRSLDAVNAKRPATTEER